MSVTGLLITSYGPTGEILADDGSLLTCHMRKNADPVITGDRVSFDLQPDGTAIITGHLPRHSLLYRPPNKKKLIAANIDCLITVAAPPALFSEDRIDRSIVAAHALGLPALILLHKKDLLTGREKDSLTEKLQIYQKAGFSTCESSTRIPEGMDLLREHLKGKSAVLTGPSGVGKSSIIAVLTGDTTIRTGDVSGQGRGKHTTTATRLYLLPGGGSLIDSPGIREFSLQDIDAESLFAGYPEFAPYEGKCRFRNCRHLAEPDCALVAASKKGEISAERLSRYQNMAREIT